MRRYSKGVWRGWANHFSSHTRKESALIIEFVSGSHVAELIQQLIDIPLPHTNGYHTAIFGHLRPSIVYAHLFSRGHSPSHGQTPSRPHICYRLYIGCITNTTRGGRREGAPSWSRSRRVAQVFSCRATTAADGRRAQPAGCRYAHSLPNRPTDPNINNLLGSHQAQNNISPQSREVCDASDFESRLS